MVPNPIQLVSLQEEEIRTERERQQTSVHQYNHVNMQQEGHLQAKERSFRRNKTCLHLDRSLQKTKREIWRVSLGNQMLGPELKPHFNIKVQFMVVSDVLSVLLSFHIDKNSQIFLIDWYKIIYFPNCICEKYMTIFILERLFLFFLHQWFYPNKHVIYHMNSYFQFGAIFLSVLICVWGLYFLKLLERKWFFWVKSIEISSKFQSQYINHF